MSMSSESSAQMTSSPIKDDVHIHLGAQEAATCIAESLGTSKIRSYTFRFWSTSIRDTTSSMDTIVYREVLALKGSIVAEVDKDQLENLTKNYNSTFNCRVPRYPLLIGYCCMLRLRVPRGMYIAVEVPKHSGSLLMLYDSKWIKEVYNDFEARRDNKVESLVFLSPSNIVNLLYIMELHEDERLVLRFQALKTLGLQVTRSAFNRGIVKTPFHRGYSLILTPLYMYWAYVSVPDGHVIMTSVPKPEALTVCLVMYAADRGNRTLSRICRGSRNELRATVYNDTSLLLVHLDSYSSVRQVGFQLYFSFHNNQSAVPAKLSDISWNCSVPYASEFLYHLFCNLEVECPDAADETNCSYTSDLCGPGYLTLGGGCFFYIRRSRKTVSWTEASTSCSARGGNLASLGTLERWNAAARLLQLAEYGTDDVFVGITNSPSYLPLWYKTTHRWVDTITSYYLHSDLGFQYEGCGTIDKKKCGYMDFFSETVKVRLVIDFNCNQLVAANILCEKTIPPTQKVLLTNGTTRWPRDNTYVKCPLGHYAHHFLACDVKSSCWFGHHSLYCQSSKIAMAPNFVCTNQIERVPYTMVCDYRPDCFDNSDEDFCDVPPCHNDQFSCDNGQCIPAAKLCDGWADCRDGEDEAKCIFSHLNIYRQIPPPALVSVSEQGRLFVMPLNVSSFDRGGGGICPETHIQCLDNGYCIPMFLRCNDVYDCPGREDENGCDTCPGLYRCRASKICLRYNQLCDGHAYCPKADDEMLCNSTCPSFCVCSGLVFFCTHPFPASNYPLLRFLDASRSRITPAHLTFNFLLISLTLSKCGLETLNGLYLPNLLSLNVQDNQIRNLSQLNLDGVPQLKQLSLAGNPLAFVFNGPRTHQHLQKLDMSQVVLRVLNSTVLSAFPNLRVLNLSHCGVQRVLGEGFGVVKHLRVIDLRGCPMTWFPRGIFQDLNILQTVYAHSFKLCCPALLPVDFNLQDCFAPSDEISSCDSMLRGKEYSVCVFVLSLFAVAGNTVSFFFRTFVSKRENKLGYGNFVTHLSVSDFLMGVYLAVIGVADQVYRGTYLGNDVAWKHSTACKLAGFLSLLSSEVSALIMCLITIDRFLVLRFPFSRLHFSPKSAHVSSFIVWIAGVLLVSVPLLPVTSHWEFYSQTGICIPLPITRAEFAGHGYSFSIMIVFNFVLFVFISLGQLSIYWSVRASAMSLSNTTRKNKDLTIARRLITVAMSNFLCWFPIGVLGLLASKGFPIPGEVNVAVAIFVLPLNAAINPCLYTVNVILERRRRAHDEKLRAMLLAQLKTLN